ncbi:MAG: hypothetical protein ACW99F_09355 [Candidatus Hodarchaeales archaeon]|jgi:hypothetical protein
MYKEHPIFKKPDNENAEIWRYLDLAKFVSLLDKQALFFTRGDNLSDKFEGSVSRTNIELRENALKDQDKKIRELLLKKIPLTFKQARKWVFINCWNLHEYESAAMWNLYLKSDEGVAIQSTFKQLTRSFNKFEERDVHIGEIKYIDYDKDWIPENNLLFPFLHKRKSYEHEHEIRAMIMLVWDMGDKKPIKDLSDTGIYIPVDIDILIEKVFVSPTAEKWFKELVESIMKKYDLNKKVIKSSLASDPIY